MPTQNMTTLQPDPLCSHPPSPAQLTPPAPAYAAAGAAWRQTQLGGRPPLLLAPAVPRAGWLPHRWAGAAEGQGAAVGVGIEGGVVWGGTALQKGGIIR